MKWLEGKKTYIAAVLMVGLAGFCFWIGNDPLGALALAAGLGFVGLGHKSDRLARDLKVGIAATQKIVAKQPLTDVEKAALIAAGFDVFQELAAPVAPSLPGGGQ